MSEKSGIYKNNCFNHAKMLMDDTLGDLFSISIMDPYHIHAVTYNKTQITDGNKRLAPRKNHDT